MCRVPQNNFSLKNRRVELTQADGADLGLSGVCRFTATSKKTGAAIYGATLGRIERYGRLLPTLCALNGNLYALANSRRLRCSDRCEAFVFRLFTGLAAFGLVLQSLVVKKDLFSSGPHKILTAIDALDRTVLILRLRFADEFHL